MPNSAVFLCKPSFLPAVFLDNFLKIHVNCKDKSNLAEAISMAGMKGDTAWA
jgi:hypothetical protein